MNIHYCKTSSERSIGRSIHSSLAALKVKNKCWFLFWMSVMATLLPIASNVRGGLKENYAFYTLTCSLVQHNLYYFKRHKFTLCTRTSRQSQISHAFTCKNATFKHTFDDEGGVSVYDLKFRTRNERIRWLNEWETLAGHDLDLIESSLLRKLFGYSFCLSMVFAAIGLLT